MDNYHHKTRTTPRRVEDVILQANLTFLTKMCRLATRLNDIDNIKTLLTDSLDSIETKQPVGSVFAGHLQHTIKSFVEGK